MLGLFESKHFRWLVPFGDNRFDQFATTGKEHSVVKWSRILELRVTAWFIANDLRFLSFESCSKVVVSFLFTGSCEPK